MKYAKLVMGKYTFFLFILLVLFFISPAFLLLQDYKTLIIGDWHAHWTIKNHDSAKYTNNQMGGQMVFNEDGKVYIEALGYPGCIFSSDTIKNDLMWKVNNDSLHIFNQNDQFKLSYLINKASNNLIELQLLDDIFVTLKK